MNILDADTLRGMYRRMLAVPASRRWAFGLLMPGFAVAIALLCDADDSLTMRCVLLPMLTIVTLTDLAWRRIPNWIVVPSMAWSVGIAAVAGVLPSALTGGAICFAAMLGLHLLFRGGEGDVKLFAVIGAALGGSAGLEAMLAGYLLAAAFAVLLIAGRLTRRSTGPVLAGHLPMAPFFSLAVLLTASGN
ncbi:MAG: A24 family peptidase [Gemmataceae bacterium]|nr:A24 family peptidase [Gemmataceae bacterium]